MDGRTDELDAIADDYRASRVRVQGGYWALSQFYDWLTAFAGAGCGCTPDISKVSFDDKRKALEAWLERRPHSLTARIALADLWNSRAWQLRGAGPAKDTTEAAWRGMRAAMARAEEALAPIDETADPMVYFLEMNMVVPSDDPQGACSGYTRAQRRPFPPFPATRRSTITTCSNDGLAGGARRRLSPPPC